MKMELKNVGKLQTSYYFCLENIQWTCFALPPTREEKKTREYKKMTNRKKKIMKNLHNHDKVSCSSMEAKFPEG